MSNNKIMVGANKHSPDKNDTTMKKEYIKPEIEVIAQSYNEGLMTSISLGISTAPSTGGGSAKPGGDWGNVWTDPTSSSTANGTGTTGTTTTNDAWTIN